MKKKAKKGKAKYDCLKESDCLANGDAADDKEVQDEQDKNDDVVDDHGFAARHKNWVQLK